jgi:hypothetical protein
MGTSTSHTPMGLHGLVQGQLYIFLPFSLHTRRQTSEYRKNDTAEHRPNIRIQNYVRSLGCENDYGGCDVTRGHFCHESFLRLLS